MFIFEIIFLLIFGIQTCMKLANVNGEQSGAKVTSQVVGRPARGRNNKKISAVTRTGINTYCF